MQAFLATLNPMLMLFLCIAIGFVLKSTGILSDDAGKTIAKLETWVFCPALSFITMAKYCTVKSLTTHSINIIFEGYTMEDLEVEAQNELDAELEFNL